MAGIREAVDGIVDAFGSGRLEDYFARFDPNDTPQALSSLAVLDSIQADVLLPGHGEPWTEARPRPRVWPDRLAAPRSCTGGAVPDGERWISSSARFWGLARRPHRDEPRSRPRDALEPLPHERPEQFRLLDPSEVMSRHVEHAEGRAWELLEEA